MSLQFALGELGKPDLPLGLDPNEAGLYQQAFIYIISDRAGYFPLAVRMNFSLNYSSLGSLEQPSWLVPKKKIRHRHPPY